MWSSVRAASFTLEAIWLGTECVALEAFLSWTSSCFGFSDPGIVDSTHHIRLSLAVFNVNNAFGVIIKKSLRSLRSQILFIWGVGGSRFVHVSVRACKCVEVSTLAFLVCTLPSILAEAGTLTRAQTWRGLAF